MTRIDARAIAFPCWIILGLSFAALAAVPLAHTDERIWLAGEPSKGLPACEEFFDKWEVPGAPSGILAMAGLGRELFAAKDCIDKNNVPLACKHWQGLLVVIDKMGPPLSDSRRDIEELMRQHNCQAAASESKPAPKPRLARETPPSSLLPQPAPVPLPILIPAPVRLPPSDDFASRTASD